MASTMLQVPETPLASLPPSQTATLVTPMALEGSTVNQDGNWESADMSQSIATSTAPKVSLTFLLLSGKRKTFAFEQADSFASIKERLVHEWPNDWEDEIKPETSSAIRLLHLGRLVPDDETLLSNPRFPPSPAPAAIIHLSVRPYPIRAPSGTGSLKQRASLLRTGTGFSLSGRGNANAPGAPRQGASAQNTQPLDTVPEQSDSGCCCIIC